MVYSDDASIDNGSGIKGKSLLPIVPPQAMEEPKAKLVLQAQNQLVATPFGDQRIFASAPYYHWHVQGAVGVDDELGNRFLPWTINCIILFTEQKNEN